MLGNETQYIAQELRDGRWIAYPDCGKMEVALAYGATKEEAIRRVKDYLGIT